MRPVDHKQLLVPVRVKLSGSSAPPRIPAKLETASFTFETQSYYPAAVGWYRCDRCQWMSPYLVATDPIPSFAEDSLHEHAQIEHAT